MSQSLWCDVDDADMNARNMIGHPFSGNDPEKHHFADTRPIEVHTGNSYGQPTYQNREEVTDEFDMCGYHWNKRNPFSAKREAITPPKPTLEELEEDDNDYRRGYEAGVDHTLNAVGH